MCHRENIFVRWQAVSTLEVGLSARGFNLNRAGFERPDVAGYPVF